MGKKKRGRVPHYFDYNLLFLIIFIIAFGLVMLYSATAFTASLNENNPTYYLKRQLSFSILGLVVMAFVTFIPMNWIKKLAPFITLLSVLSVFLLFVPGLTSTSHGATRWLRFGPVSIQPAELVKIGAIVFMAYILPTIRKRIVGRNAFLLCMGIGFVLAAPVMFISDNLSSAIIIFGIVAIMYFIAHPKYAPFMLTVLVGAALVFLLVFVISPKMVDVNFRFRRIEAWKNPAAYADSTAYQTLQALYAIGSGGLFGKGLGKSAQKLIIPEAQNDMIFSIVCEELGVVGAIAVLFVFVLILYRMLIIAKNARGRFESLLVVGVFTHIALQVVLNVMVVTNIFPNTGITLPFISYGGSATLCLLAEIGLVFNVCRGITFEDNN